jgi:ceramide glucosyltransferase
MTVSASSLVIFVTAAAATASVLYLFGCVLVVAAWRRARRQRSRARAVPITVLKPLCGLEPGLEENLRSFCREAAPDIQILFGARDGDDPALTVARRVIGEFPGVDAQIVVGSTVHGLNAKVNTLARLAPMARHDLIVIADSDVRVGDGDLLRIVEPLLDGRVGVLSCLFRSRPTHNFWSRFAALAVDELFMPSVLVSRALQSPVYCSGPVVAIRREVLEAIGGFAPLAPLLADDYELGARVRRLGYRSVLSDCEVAVTVDETSCASLARHEVRWMRTIRTVAPGGHTFSVLTYSVPLALIACAASGAAAWSLALVGCAGLLRAIIHFTVAPPVDERGGSPLRRSPLWMVIFRDFFSLGTWLASYASRTITWRGRTLWVDKAGVLHAPEDRTGRAGLTRRGGVRAESRSAAVGVQALARPRE